MKKFILLILMVFLFYPQTIVFTDEPEDEIKLYLGQTKTILVSIPAKIVISEPKVLDVTVVSEDSVTLVPKEVGVSEFTVWDSFGEQFFQIRVLPEDLTDIKARIDNLIKEIKLNAVYTRLAETEGKILLMGEVKTAQERERLNIALGPLKEKVVDLVEVKEEEAIIEIDVQVMELSKDATNTLGLTWPGSLNLLEVGSAGIASAGAKISSSLFTVEKLQRATYSGGSATADPFTFKLDALVQEGKARILSRPRLACQSGKEAELLVGGEKPILTTTVAQTTGAQGTQVQYKEFGIKLKIKPTVTEEERIKLALNVEVSDVGTAETLGAATQPTARAYPLSKRSASTELFLDDGQTMAIGGLMKQKSEEDIRKVPWLGDLPVLGLLFRKKTTKIGGGTGERGDTELFITLTPKIVGAKKEIKEAKQELKPEVIPAITDPISGYAQIIKKRILDNLTYPALAQQAGVQGTTRLALHLSYSGELIEAKLKTSSGYKILDDNALSVAKEVGTYPPFPSSIKQQELWVEIPIIYRLD